MGAHTRPNKLVEMRNLDVVEMDDLGTTVNLEVRLTRSAIQKIEESNEGNTSASEKKKNVSFIDDAITEGGTRIIRKVKAARTKRNKKKSQEKILSGSITSDEEPKPCVPTNLSQMRKI